MVPPLDILAMLPYLKLFFLLFFQPHPQCSVVNSPFVIFFVSHLEVFAPCVYLLILTGKPGNGKIWSSAKD